MEQRMTEISGWLWLETPACQQACKKAVRSQHEHNFKNDENI